MVECSVKLLIFSSQILFLPCIYSTLTGPIFNLLSVSLSHYLERTIRIFMIQILKL